ncbi:chloromuconate cycloisomerase [Candidatus Kaistella beijingensis]|uniref:enolase C-terminal domain-like protein n=1 Tax=Candidatus Kaistella beijingensis TaxID=2820270 RepID=UPI001CC33803|nr:enolase C-terminal domain-like protein [Candidatus Kaistella beijingensis]UBB88868.1 chloromuconate cycloisomerase [Candidatus Kaistella beijingensis]
MKLSWQPKKLLLKETFSISYGNYDFRDALLISLSYKDKIGFGECVAINYYGINLDEFILKLKEIQTKIEAKEIVHPKEFYQFLTSLNLHSFLCSALDCAYWDLYGKLENKSFSQLNYLNSSNLPESSYTISIALVDEQIQKIQNSDWQKFKVKCNGLDQNYTFKLLETGKQIALDSNTSFSDDDCNFLQNNELTRNFLYIEQPRPVGEFQVLNKNLNAVWMADEDCQNSSYLEKLQPHYSAINIKLMKCGGITPALQLIREAKKFGYKIMIGCMTESSVGISAGIAVASLCDFADLDGANLISNDFARGSFVEKGKLILSENAGLGISLL